MTPRGRDVIDDDDRDSVALLHSAQLRREPFAIRFGNFDVLLADGVPTEKEGFRGDRACQVAHLTEDFEAAVEEQPQLWMALMERGHQAAHRNRRGPPRLGARQRGHVAIERVEEEAAISAFRKRVRAREDLLPPRCGRGIDNHAVPAWVRSDDRAGLDVVGRRLAHAEVREDFDPGAIQLGESLGVEIVGLHDDPVEMPQICYRDGLAVEERDGGFACLRGPGQEQSEDEKRQPARAATHGRLRTNPDGKLVHAQRELKPVKPALRAGGITARAVGETPTQAKVPTGRDGLRTE